MKGIFQQIQEQPVYNPKPPTKKQIKKFFETMEKNEREFRKKIDKMEKEHTKHFIDRAKELGEEIPMWLMLITSPYYNKGNGGHFYTSAEFIKKHEKWLK